MTEIGRCLHHLDELELAMARFYNHYGRVFAADHEAAAFFARMEREEVGHSDLVRFQLSVIAKNKALVRDCAIDLAPITAIIEHIERALAAQHAPTLADVLRAAIALETDAAEQHYRTAMRGIDENLATLVRGLAAADRGHLQTLLDFARARGVTGAGGVAG